MLPISCNPVFTVRRTVDSRSVTINSNPDINEDGSSNTTGTGIAYDDHKSTGPEAALLYPSYSVLLNSSISKRVTCATGTLALH